MNTRTNGVDPLVVRANKLDLLEQVADDLAHEIKNPLHSMVINLEVLKRRIARSEASGTADMLRYTDVLGSELDRVSHRVDLLLRMVRPARAGDRIPLHEIVEEIRELVEVEAGRRSIALVFEPTALGGRVSVPREAGRQVVLNLILTALDALESGDALQIVTRRDDDQALVRVIGVPDSARVAADAGGRAPIEAVVDGSRHAIACGLGEAIGGRIDHEVLDGSFSLSFTLPVLP